jgi:hypothetical protein
MNRHRKEVARQVGNAALLTVGVIASGALGLLLWILAVMYV